MLPIWIDRNSSIKVTPDSAGIETRAIPAMSTITIKVTPDSAGIETIASAIGWLTPGSK